MKDLLIEILVEEVPANFALPASLSFKKIIETLFKNNSIKYEECISFTTPRRLSILAKKVSQQAEDEFIESKGPLYESAYQNGEVTKTGSGFFNANKIDINLIKSLTEEEKLNTPYLKCINGKKYIVIKKEKTGIKTYQLIKDNLEKIVSEINFPKKMRWGVKDFAFVRPIKNVVALFGSDVIETTVAEIKTNNKITGHRLLSPSFEEIKNPADYEEMLLKKNVIVSREKRLLNIIKQLEDIENKFNLKAVDKNKVSEIVVDLVEYPYLLTTEFDKKFLEVPKEVLTSEMIEHQKYFPLVDKNNKLTNTFVITANQPETKYIIGGNIRVLTARLSDGRFLYQEDLKYGLDYMNKKLDALLFRKELGSIKEKVLRITKNAEEVIKELNYENKKEDILKTIEYMKSDLVSNMVYQFPELQGIMGGYFAKENRLNDEISTAIREQYKPVFSGDTIPTNDVGKCVAILDKLDNIISGFYVNDIPTGSQDPNALRRQALGIINILVQSKKHIDIKNIISYMINNMPKDALKNKSQNITNDILEFFKSRFENDMQTTFSYDAIHGVLSTGLTDIYDSYLKIVEVDNFRKNNDILFSNLMTVFKRITNIIKNVELGEVKESLLKEKAEIELNKIYKEKSLEINELIKNKNYGKSFNILASFYEPLDTFFKDVMVMDKDDNIRNNRIVLLSSIDKLFKTMMDFSVLVVK